MGSITNIGILLITCLAASLFAQQNQPNGGSRVPRLPPRFPPSFLRGRTTSSVSSSSKFSFPQRFNHLSRNPQFPPPQTEKSSFPQSGTRRVFNGQPQFPLGFQSGQPRFPGAQSGQPRFPQGSQSVQPRFPQQGFQPGQPKFSQGVRPGQSRFPQGFQPGQPRFPGVQTGQPRFPLRSQPGHSRFPQDSQKGQPRFPQGIRPGQPRFSQGVQSGQPRFPQGVRPGQPKITPGQFPSKVVPNQGQPRFAIPAERHTQQQQQRIFQGRVQVLRPRLPPVAKDSGNGQQRPTGSIVGRNRNAIRRFR